LLESSCSKRTQCPNQQSVFESIFQITSAILGKYISPLKKIWKKAQRKRNFLNFKTSQKRDDGMQSRVFRSFQKNIIASLKNM